MRRFVCLVLFGALATAAMAAPATASPNLSIDHNPPAHLRPAAAVGILGAGASTAPETDSPNISTAAAARALGVVGVAATDTYDLIDVNPVCQVPEPSRLARLPNP